MDRVILVIHLILAFSIIGLVLLQRSEGGGLGIGGGGGLGGLATPKGAASIMTRATAICAGFFFITSLVLGVLAGTQTRSVSILDTLDEPKAGIVQQKAEEEAEEETERDVTIPRAQPSAPVSE